MELKKTPVIIDCDPGTDDAVAILMMLGCNKFDVVGICPVNGNKGLDMTEPNALRLCELAGREDIPVLKGARKGILLPQRTAGDIHGSNGLGGIPLPEPVKKAEDKYAWDFMYEQAVKYNGELEILAIGPLTNLGIAVLKYPDFPKMVKRLTIMGGALYGGNHTATAEFNIWVDPHAAKIVFESGMDIAMMGLEVCETAVLKRADVERIEPAGKATKFARELLEQGLSWGAEFGMDGCAMCDPTAAYYMICPDGMDTEEVHIDVETKGIITEGTTVATRDFTENVKYVRNCTSGVRVHREKFAEVAIECLNNLNRK